MFNDIGANTISTNGIHFRNKSMTPTKTSMIPTIGKIYPVAPNEFIKSAAGPTIGGNGIKCKNLFAPKIISRIANAIRTILVNIESIKSGFRLISNYILSKLLNILISI